MPGDLPLRLLDYGRATELVELVEHHLDLPGWLWCVTAPKYTRLLLDIDSPAPRKGRRGTFREASLTVNGRKGNCFSTFGCIRGQSDQASDRLPKDLSY